MSVSLMKPILSCSFSSFGAEACAHGLAKKVAVSATAVAATMDTNLLRTIRVTSTPLALRAPLSRAKKMLPTLGTDSCAESAALPGEPYGGPMFAINAAMAVPQTRVLPSFEARQGLKQIHTGQWSPSQTQI